jgi:hypothetical protein
MQQHRRPTKDVELTPWSIISNYTLEETVYRGRISSLKWKHLQTWKS